MKKEKPARKNRSREELDDYFSGWQFDPARQCINKIRQEHPEVRDDYVISAAADEMLNAAYTGVLLSTDDALRLVEYREPIPTEALVKELRDSGVTEENFLELIAGARMSEEDYSDCVISRHALYAVNRLQRYADILTRNMDILLLMLPEYSHHSDQVSVVIAFLGEELSDMEQKILALMKQTADSFMMKTKDEIIRISFFIDNVWEKP